MGSTVSAILIRVPRVSATSRTFASVLTLALGVSVMSPRALAQTSQGGAVPSSPIPAGEVRDAQARFGALRATPSADIAVVAESVVLSCEDADDALATCTFEAHWTLRAPREQTTQLYASAVGVENALLTAGEASTDAPTLASLELTLAADAPTEVVLTGRARLRSSGSSTDALDARHIVLATPRQGPHANVLYTRAVARTFASTPAEVTLAVRFAGERSFTARALDTPVGETATSLGAPQLGERANIPLRIEREGGFVLRHGGPFLGLGGTFDRGFRARLGYEVGIDELVLVSVAIDSDFTDSVLLAALVEVATPSFGLPPSVSAGVGFVQRFRLGILPAGVPTTSSGLRLEAGTVIAVVGIVASFDYFPDDGAFTISLLGRVSI
jgi:hypothetical protein